MRLLASALRCSPSQRGLWPLEPHSPAGSADPAWLGPAVSLREFRVCFANSESLCSPSERRLSLAAARPVSSDRCTIGASRAVGGTDRVRAFCTFVHTLCAASGLRLRSALTPALTRLLSVDYRRLTCLRRLFRPNAVPARLAPCLREALVLRPSFVCSLSRPPSSLSSGGKPNIEVLRGSGLSAFLTHSVSPHSRRRRCVRQQA